MKGNETPQFSKKWWDKNKAKTLLKTGVGKALQDYEIARAKDDDELTLKTLSALKKAIANAVGKADPKRHAETITVLKKFPKLIEQEIKLANTRLKKDAEAAKAPPKQKMGKPVVIWEGDLALLVKKKYDPDWLKDFKNFKLKLTLNDDILDALEAEGDLVTPAFMVEDAQGIGDAAADAIVKMVRKIDNAAAGKPPAIVNKARGMLEPFVEKEFKLAAKKLAGVPETRWKTFVARNKQYKDYKIKAGLEVTKGTLGVIGAGVGIVGSGGAGLALGIVALVRSTAGLVKQLYDLAIDADKAGKELGETLQTLQDRYVDAKGQANKKTQAAAETAGSVLKGILGTDAPFIATLPKANAKYELWDNKIAGVTVAGRKASKTITEALKQCAVLEKKIQKAEGKTAQKVFKNLVKIRKNLDTALNKTSDLMAKVNRFEKNGPALKKVLDALNKQNSDFAKIFDKVFPAAVNLALSGAGSGVGFKEAETVLDTVNTSLGLANDILSEGEAALEEALG